jgi:hypothetical protein
MMAQLELKIAGAPCTYIKSVVTQRDYAERDIDDEFRGDVLNARQPIAKGKWAHIYQRDWDGSFELIEADESELFTIIGKPTFSEDADIPIRVWVADEE